MADGKGYCAYVLPMSSYIHKRSMIASLSAVSALPAGPHPPEFKTLPNGWYIDFGRLRLIAASAGG